ncbi:MAG TPA: hypothetical protein VGL72_24720, partial [Bryobacteraceae bacterium]
MNQAINQTTRTRKSMLAAVCFCFATSLAAQTAAGQESTSFKKNPTTQEPQIVASLTHPDFIPAMPLTNPVAVTSAADHSSTPVLPAPVDTPQVKLLASSSLPTSSYLSAATAVRWTAVTP